MNAIDITLVIRGEAGQGIQTVGRLLSHACHEAGLYVFAVNDFESRIRGGHSFFKLRISDRPRAIFSLPFTPPRMTFPGLFSHRTPPPKPTAPRFALSIWRTNTRSRPLS